MSREFDRGQLQSRHRAALMVRHPLDRHRSMPRDPGVALAASRLN